MKLEPNVIVVPYLRTWAQGQLPASDVVGTILANSMIETCGYNIWPPGRTPDLKNRSWKKDKLAAIDQRSWLIDQLEISVATNKGRIKVLTFLDSLSVVQMNWTVSELINLLEEEVERGISKAEDIAAAIKSDRQIVAQSLQSWKRECEMYLTMSTLVHRIEDRLTMDDPAHEAPAQDEELWEEQ